MKKLTLSLIAVFGIAIMSFAGGGGKEKLTTKEKLDKQGTVHVYFDLWSVSSYSEGPEPTSPAPCKRFPEKTEFTEAYTNEIDNIISMLNSGLKTEVFKKGDIETVPVHSVILDHKVRDWTKHTEKYVVVVTLNGNYKVQSGSGTLVNSLEITAQISIFEIENGKLKNIKNTAIAKVVGKAVKTTQCDDIAYFKKNFPLENYEEEFQNSIKGKTTDFVAKLMAKHEKAVSKRK